MLACIANYVLEAFANEGPKRSVEFFDPFLTVTVYDAFVEVSSEASIATLLGKPFVRVAGLRFANRPSKDHDAVVAVAGGEQMQISLSVYWMFRERGVNCTELYADTVGNMDGDRDAYETSSEPARAQHATRIRYLPGPNMYPGPNMQHAFRI